MRTSILFILTIFIFTACDSNDGGLKISIFNATPGASQASVEINGKEDSKIASYGELVSGYKVDTGLNTINLISSTSNNNPLSSFEGDIESSNSILFFAATNQASGENSLLVSLADAPEPGNSSAQVRFTNVASIPDTVRFVITEDGTQAADTTSEMPFGSITEYSEANVELGSSTSYSIRAIALREVSTPSGGFTTEYVNLASLSTSVQGTEVINFVLYGFESVTAGLQVTGFKENK